MTSRPTFKPTLILHGGAGAIHRSTLPPDLYAKYHASLLSYLRSTRSLLENGTSALDAVVHAVSLMEDDELFNCGRGSVFTSAGTIEMEASVMVTSESMKRGAGVIGLKNVRHPIQLAREVLLRTGQDENGDLIEGEEGLGGRDGGLEFKSDEWFWTQKRWDEHRRKLESGKAQGESKLEPTTDEGYPDYHSQGTVGCVGLDQWGNLAVATSTGGLTNKFPGRVGDTPTLGAGFWTEAWDLEGSRSGSSFGEQSSKMVYSPPAEHRQLLRVVPKSIWDTSLADCLPGLSRTLRESFGSNSTLNSDMRLPPERPQSDRKLKISSKKRRAIAVLGTGNGDSFLRTAAARTTCARMQFSQKTVSLAKAVAAVASADGELRHSAGRRWDKTSEGQGGIIGIEAELDDDSTVVSKLRRGKVVFDFNCGGMFRAWVDEDENGSEFERVMVFKEAYQ
ncbi:nucleophile aminohydrolase [Aspergillus crustosus]